MIASLSDLDRRTWLRAVPLAAVAAVLIAVPSDLLDTRLFGRPVPVRGVDYVILATTAMLIGLILAIRPPTDTVRAEAEERRALWGGFVSFLAVGCPVCNQLVVGLVGTAGALSWWAPAQPFVGAAAIALLVYTLRMRLETSRLTGCPLPG